MLKWRFLIFSSGNPCLLKNESYVVVFFSYFIPLAAERKTEIDYEYEDDVDYDNGKILLEID